MNYSSTEAHVRADFFKTSGKWKYTDTLDMTGLFWSTCGDPDHHPCPAAPHPKGCSLIEALAFAWSRLGLSRPDGRTPYTDLVMVVLQPCHEYAHPVALRIDRITGSAIPAWDR